MNIDKIESSYRVLNAISNESHYNQRSLAESLGFSLGKINFILKEFGKKGFLKLHRFSQSSQKRRYLYVLTPEGVLEKIRVTKNFLQIKEREYIKLQKEIQEAKAKLRSYPRESEARHVK